MVDLTTKYLGLDLKNPLVMSASVLSEKVSTVKEYERAGISAVVMYSLFEEQIIHDSMTLDHYLDYGTESYAEALSFFPDVGRYSIGPETYLDHLRQLKNELDIPVIASLNGVTRGKWMEYAERMEASGADALELNLYFLPTNPDQSAEELENEYIELVKNIRVAINIPLALKLSPFFTSIPNIAKKFEAVGANGLVLFNRFYQPDFDLEDLEVVPNLHLSHPSEMRLPLRWISILHGQVNLDMALTTGVHSGEDVIKSMMAGAKVTMVASEFIRNGAGRASEIISEMEMWMNDHDYDSINMMQGAMSQSSVGDPSMFERVNYINVLSSKNYLP